MNIRAGVLPDGGPVLPALSERQYDVLKCVYQYAIEHRDFPLGIEIATRLGMTKQRVQPMTEALIKKGYLYKDPLLTRRNIRLTEAAMEKMRREDSTRDLFSEEN